MQPPHALELELAQFPGRDEALRRVTRWQLYPVMYYRTDLLTHSRRLSWHVRAAAPVLRELFGDAFDIERAIAVALVHDDHEVVLGDVQLANKLRMTPEQMAKLETAERRAIDQTAARFPAQLGRYTYRDLLLEKLELYTLESQVVTYLDKWEGYNEALHEVYGGNIVFVTPQTNHLGTHPIGTTVYTKVLNEFAQKFPQTAPLFSSNQPMFSRPPQLDYEDINQHSSPHTPTSLRQPTGHPHYDAWRDILAEYAPPDEWTRLHQPAEDPHAS